MRKHYFNNKDDGYFATQKREPVVKNPMTGTHPPSLLLISIFTLVLQTPQ